MLKNTIRLEGPVTARIDSLSLVPQFNDWRTRPGDPVLAYRVKLALPLPPEPGEVVSKVVKATMWIGADVVTDTVTGEEKIATLGVESGTAMIPTADAMGAVCEEEEGHIKLVDGLPVPTGRDAGKSHWNCARLVPVRGGATLTLLGITVMPVHITSGPDAGELARTKKDEQVVSIAVEDWEPGQRLGRRAGGEARSVLAGKGANVPTWVHEQRDAEAEHATA